MIHGAPGIGGSLGTCILCGKSFVAEVLLGKSVQTAQIAGIEGDVCFHEACMKTMESLKGKPWEDLPPGPLRECYERATIEPKP